MAEYDPSTAPRRLEDGFKNDGWIVDLPRDGSETILQLDTGNASEMEGVTMVDLIKRNAGRTVSMHVKPFSKKNPDAYLGADELDWPAIMKAGETVGGVEWYIIEYEREGVPPLESLEANLDRFRKMRS